MSFYMKQHLKYPLKINYNDLWHHYFYILDVLSSAVREEKEMRHISIWKFRIAFFTIYMGCLFHYLHGSQKPQKIHKHIRFSHSVLSDSL